jgi:GNAT superfamily N-acetyltransferase
VQIRPATDDDWPRIWPFFASIVEAGETYAYPDVTTAEDARPWWMERLPGRTVVGVDGSDVLGSAKMGPNRPGRGAHVATASFMVDPAHSGRGLGRALGEHVLAWARDSGYRSMQFNAVWRRTPRPCGCGRRWASTSSVRSPRPSTPDGTGSLACT